VKICGLTNLEDVLCAQKAGADAIGFVFAKSPRQVLPKEVRQIAAVLLDTVAKVGLFVNSPLDYILETVDTCGLNAVQLHGDESPEFAAAVARGLTALERETSIWPSLVKAFSPRSQADLAPLSDYHGIDAYLVDAYVPGLRGGSGRVANWGLARAVKEFGPVILAGGLNCENVETAVCQVAPIGVDVSSGVELSPGKKDHNKIKDFICKVKQ